MNYGEWLHTWLEMYVKPTVKKKTYVNYYNVIMTHILPSLGKHEFEELTFSVLQNYVLELTENGNKLTGAGLAPSTVGLIVSILQKSLRFAVEVGVAERQFSDHIKRPRVSENKTECFSVAEQHRIEAEILSKPPNKKLGILLCLYTGVRIGELLALKWSDVDLQSKTITVRATCRDGYPDGILTKILDSPKTASSRRMIPIPKQIVPHLRALKKGSKSEYVISNPGGEIVSVRSYQKLFETMLARLGIPRKCFHTLRHTFATRALECGMDVKTLSEILGHKSPNVTLNRYAHCMLEHKTAMMNRVGMLLK